MNTRYEWMFNDYMMMFTAKRDTGASFPQKSLRDYDVSEQSTS